MKRVLIITYHWPPMGGSEVLRWLKLTKYLPDYGWRPVVFTAETPDGIFRDESLERDVSRVAEIMRSPLPEKTFFVDKLEHIVASGMGTAESLQDVNPNSHETIGQVSIRLLSNLQVPDALASWVKPSVDFLTEYLRHERVDAILSTGPPHSMHLIALDLKRVLDIPWIADFRRPWVYSIYHERLPLWGRVRKKHLQHQEDVLTSADRMITATPSWLKRLRIAGGSTVETVTNGFDQTDLPATVTLRTDKFRITHYGMMTSECNHEVLWEALRAVSSGVVGFKSALEIEMIGRVDSSVVDMAVHYGLGDNLVQTDRMNHADALAGMASSHVLLLPLNRTEMGGGLIPANLFDYFATRRPILLIGSPEGDAGRLVEETGTGAVIAFDDFHNLKTLLSGWYDLHLQGQLHLESASIEQYSWPRLSSRVAAILDEATTSMH